MIHTASPNHGPRRDGLRPDLVVLHYTAMASARSALDRLCDPATEVSAHYLISRNGTGWQLVDEEQRAWHAGAGSWGGVGDVNSRSIGIELDNPGTCPFPEPQMTALESLLGDILDRHAIPPRRVIAHSDMAPERKCDPGRRFDWRRLARRSLSVWPDPRDDGPDPDPIAFAAAATAFGYPADLSASLRLSAFRLRFRPWATGPLVREDMAAMADLAARFAVDGKGTDA